MELGMIVIGGLSVAALGGKLSVGNSVNVEEIASKVVDVVNESSRRINEI